MWYDVVLFCMFYCSGELSGKCVCYLSIGIVAVMVLNVMVLFCGYIGCCMVFHSARVLFMIPLFV